MLELGFGSSVSIAGGGDARISLEKRAMSVGVISIGSSEGGIPSWSPLLSRLETSELAPMGLSVYVPSVAAKRAWGVSRGAVIVRRTAEGREACLVASEQGLKWSERGGRCAEATYVECRCGMVQGADGAGQ